jgi:hypothetical protein
VGRERPLDVCFGLPRRSALHRTAASNDEIDDEVGAYAAAGVTWLTLQSRATAPGDMHYELDRWAPVLSRHAAEASSSNRDGGLNS